MSTVLKKEHFLGHPLSLKLFWSIKDKKWECCSNCIWIAFVMLKGWQLSFHLFDSGMCIFAHGFFVHHFHYEGDLEFYNYYTIHNCVFECGIKLTESRIGCVPWYLPRSNNSTTCDPWTEREFTESFNSINSNSSLCSHCLPNCESTEYSISVSSAKFREVFFKNSIEVL